MTTPNQLTTSMPTMISEMICKSWHEIETKDHCKNGQHCVSVDAECNSLLRSDEHAVLCCCCSNWHEVGERPGDNA